MGSMRRLTKENTERMQRLTKENAERRDHKRTKKTGEVFTPPVLVNQMLDKLPKKVWKEDLDNTFCDPACGNGNFLIEILKRKLNKGHDSTEALKSIYGLDIKKDNIRECRLRLLKIIELYKKITKEHIKIVFVNIRFLNLTKHPRGTLDYDMSFKSNYNNRNIDEWFEKIQDGELDLVDLPVEDNDIVPARDKNGNTYNMDSADMFNMSDDKKKKEKRE